jgi:hypothetical protein
MNVASMDDGVARRGIAARRSSRLRGDEPLVCYQQLQQDQGQGGGPVPAPRLTQLSLIEEITWL